MRYPSFNPAFTLPRHSSSSFTSSSRISSFSFPSTYPPPPSSDTSNSTVTATKQRPGSRRTSISLPFGVVLNLTTDTGASFFGSSASEGSDPYIVDPNITAPSYYSTVDSSDFYSTNSSVQLKSNQEFHILPSPIIKFSQRPLPSPSKDTASSIQAPPIKANKLTSLLRRRFSDGPSLLVFAGTEEKENERGRTEKAPRKDKKKESKKREQARYVLNSSALCVLFNAVGGSLFYFKEGRCL